MPTVRSCEIVSRLKNDNGDILFDLKKMQEVLQEKSHVIREWAYIIHDKDKYSETDESKESENKKDTLKPEHIHLILRFERQQPQNTKYIAKWFNISENFVSKVHGTWSDCVCYLSHRNAPEKHQYSLDEIKSNFNVESIIEHAKNKTKFEDILQRILSG